MTQKDKELLLKDLCARLPYGVKILNIPANVVGELFLVSTTDMVEYEPVDETDDDNWTQTLYNIKPYLRLMSSMTEEEKKIMRCYGFELFTYGSGYTGFNNMESCIDEVSFKFMEEFLNSHHFDYRGLIPMGLALEAKEGMYKTE